MELYSVTLADINKALEPKKNVDPSQYLPEWLGTEFLKSFLLEEANKLPAYRTGIYLHIPLQSDNFGKEKPVPWCAMYNNSRDELLVLRKTLTELLEKDFIRVNKSSAGAPVLFVKKPVKKTKYLGYIIDVNKGISMETRKVEAIKEWEAPKTIKGVRGFLGFANFYRMSIKDYSNLVLPLTQLTQKDVPFVFDEKCQKAFEHLKELFIESPILANFDPDRRTVVEPDASNWAVGGVLLQYNDTGILKPVAHFSKKNLPAECNYPIHDKELLASICCLDEWDAK
uniref:TE4 n=1 Tax=Blumeria hordei TaxID=2867405 RepID=A8U3S8_BLUHO|nr:TE4 [Blumeria hordei]